MRSLISVVLVISLLFLGGCKEVNYFEDTQQPSENTTENIVISSQETDNGNITTEGYLEQLLNSTEGHIFPDSVFDYDVTDTPLVQGDD